MFWQDVGPKTAKTAIGFTVSHDHHNIQVMGNDQESLSVAANRLRATGGGYVLVQNGKVVDEVILEVGGLMSARPAAEVGKDFQDFWKEVARLDWYAPPGTADVPAVSMAQMKWQIFATLTCTPWQWVLVAPFSEPVMCQSGLVNVVTGQCSPVVW